MNPEESCYLLVAAASAAQLHAIDVLVEETEREHGPETVQRLLDQPYGPDNYTALHLAVTRRDSEDLCSFSEEGRAHRSR